MGAQAVMVLGTTSGAGKSWLATALCRWYARQGLRVAPFKAQNMSNNARVVRTKDGDVGEMASAQYFQAMAAGVPPDARMNPVLLKPESELRSQVVVRGHVRSELASVPWRERSHLLWPTARSALHELLAEFEVVVIEGAGSPAEINLHSCDYVNMRTALEARAACLLVADIDRGGAFAHLLGTYLLLQEQERALIRGFVLNRFRGDKALLSPAPQELERMTGVPTIAVLPMWRAHGLPDEDGIHDASAQGRSAGARRVAVVAYPSMSNNDELQPLRHQPLIDLVWARAPFDLAAADVIILPGSKQVASDLAWLREAALDTAIQRFAQANGPVLGICGGMHMLGMSLSDPGGVDGAGTGLGLLPIETSFQSSKLLRATAARFGTLDGPWSALSGLELEGYEIRHGCSSAIGPFVGSRVALHAAQGEPIGWQRGTVLGIAMHGLLESPRALAALFSTAANPLENVLDGLADFVDQHIGHEKLMGLLQPWPAARRTATRPTGP